MAHEAAQLRAHFDPARRLAGSQNHRDRAALLRVVDMNGQETTLVPPVKPRGGYMGVEQRQLLMAVRDVAGVVMSSVTVADGVA